MRLSARLRRALANAWLIMQYPSLSIIFHAHPTGDRLAAIVVLLVAMAAIYVVFWLRFADISGLRIISGFVVVLFVLAIALNVVGGWTVNPFLLALIIAGYAYPLPVAIAAVSALTALSLGLTIPALQAVHYTTTDIVAVEVIAGVQLVIFGFGAVGAAWLVNTIRQLHQAREQLALMAVEQERARFARDVHDLIGHNLSVITLKGELAQQLIESAPDRAKTELRELVGVARNALREVREAVSGYRQPTLASELAGARAALAAAGIACNVDQSAGALTAENEAVLAWTVREGVTNVLRHSKARRCSIVLNRDDDAVQLEVVDDGATVGSPRAGNGLLGLGERVRERGGRLEAGPLPHQGFRLRVLLPTGAQQLAPEPSASGDSVS